MILILYLDFHGRYIKIGMWRKNMKRDLTQGNILKNVIIFSLPFLLSYFLQILYGMADLFIIGQYNGADVITAVSVGSQITYMLTIVIVGLAMGSLVLIVGANNQKQISKTIGNRIFLQYLVYLLFYYSFYQSIILYILCLHY